MKHLLLLPTLLVFSLLVAACLDDGDRVAAPAPIATRAPEQRPRSTSPSVATTWP